MTVGIQVSPNPAPPQSASAIIQQALADMGLQSLGAQTWQWHLEGRPDAQILLDIQDTPEYKARFPAMKTLAAEGRAITPAQYINYEQNAAALWHAAGLPADQITQGDYFTKWLEGDVSINELTHRIQDLYVKVANTAPEVRTWYAQHYNNGDAALAATFADTENSVPVLERQAAAAEFGGAGARFGYNIDTATAGTAADIGVTAGQAEQGFQQVQTLNPLFHQWVGEQQNLTAENQGVQAVFGFGQDAQAEIQRAARAREALFAGSTQSGGARTQGGLGLGVAQPNSG